MIAELGHFSMILGLFLAVAQSGLGLVGAARDDGLWMAGAGATAIAQFAGLTVAFAALTYGHVVSDFSLATVAANSHSAMPMLYKVTGVWGNHEGSMLLWVLILALFGAAITLFGMDLPAPLRARVLGVQGLVGVGFLLFWRPPPIPSRGWRRHRWMAPISTHCSRTRGWPSIRRCCISAMLACRWPFPSLLRR